MPIDPNEVNALWRIVGGGTILSLILGTRKFWLPYVAPVCRAAWIFLLQHWQPHRTIESQRLEIRRERSMRLYAERQLVQATEDIERLAQKAQQLSSSGSTDGEKAIAAVAETSPLE